MINPGQSHWCNTVHYPPDRYFAIANNVAVPTTMYARFYIVELCLQGRLLEERWIDQKVRAYIVLVGLPQFLSTGVVPVSSPNSNV